MFLNPLVLLAVLAFSVLIIVIGHAIGDYGCISRICGSSKNDNDIPK